ncbi:MAG: RNB domain-containing ribonuclease [Actinomycetota bacterium]|nr:RNB domain-containing ribonuclease [Actinomycetota bacterium]
MRALVDDGHVLDSGLAAIRTQFQVPAGFSPAVEAAAAEAARRAPTAHVDRTDQPFVTLDPATSTDLDQAFTIEWAGDDLLLHYAIADVGWFVQPGDPLDTEAWQRGSTLYLPDGKAGLYPRSLAEGAASLLPDGPRPAVVFQVRLDAAGTARLDGAERALIHSRAKLAYDTVTAADLPAGFDEFSRRVAAAEAARGAGIIDPPEQHVHHEGGHYRLTFRPRLPSEDQNAAMSLAANLAVADAMQTAGVGLFRVMEAPDERAVRRLRHTATAFGLQWPAGHSLEQFSRTLDGARPADAAFMMAARRAGGGAEYRPYEAGVVPWHAAMAATYAHATAPLRRLADRHVVETVLAIANGNPVPEQVAAAIPELPATMAKADRMSNTIERAVVDLAEAVILHGSEGDTFDAIVTDDDEDGTRIQLTTVAVKARVRAHGVKPGDPIRVKLVAADPVERTVEFARVG